MNWFNSAFRFGLMLPFVISGSLQFGCKFLPVLKPQERIKKTSDSGVIISDSVVLDRGVGGEVLNLTFETKAAAFCKISFLIAEDANKSAPKFTDCINASATKFAETLSGAPKDSLVVVFIKAWSANEPEAASTIFKFAETSAAATDGSINFLMVDINAKNMNISGVASDSNPSDIIEGALKPVECLENIGSSEDGLRLSKSNINLLSATSRGFINASTNRISNTTLATTFSITQMDSTEWILSARMAAGFGQLRINKPTLLKQVSFAGTSQADGISDSLEDIDPPGLRVNSNSTLVSTWELNGDGIRSVATLSVSPVEGFSGISCRAPAAAGKITIPASLVAKMPSGRRLWATLRVDSWQPLDSLRWVVRVSDWQTMGIQRL